MKGGYLHLNPSNIKPTSPPPNYSVLEKVDLFGCSTLDMSNQEKGDLAVEFTDVFSRYDLDMGKTSIVKHEIKLKLGSKPFKECYQLTPPGIYDEGG